MLVINILTTGGPNTSRVEIVGVYPWNILTCNFYVRTRVRVQNNRCLISWFPFPS